MANPPETTAHSIADAPIALDAENGASTSAKATNGPWRQRFAEWLAQQHMPVSLADNLLPLYLPLARYFLRAKPAERALVLGVSGGQGSGKTTLSRILRWVYTEVLGEPCCQFSIDDIYLTHAERQQLARDSQPLLATRGVPGTHDVPMGLALLRRLSTQTEGEQCTLPVFNKANDDRAPEADWVTVQGRQSVVLFEGWCIGARPQAESELAEPINRLEREEDADGHWRRFVNQQLQGAYRELFGCLDRLLFLQVPGIDSIFQWRKQQEQELLAHSTGASRALQSDQALERFIMHYERVTRHILANMPGYADVTLTLNKAHGYDRIHVK